MEKVAVCMAGVRIASMQRTDGQPGTSQSEREHSLDPTQKILSSELCSADVRVMRGR